MNQQGSDVPVRYEPSDELVHREYTYYPTTHYSTRIDSQETDWRGLWSLVREKTGWILAAGVLGGVVGFAASRFQEPVYKTTAKVYLEQTDEGSGPIREEDVFEGAGWTGVFTSNSVLEPVIRQFRLYIQPVEPQESDLVANFQLRDEAIGGRYHVTIEAGGTYELTREGSAFRETGSVENAIGESAGFAWVIDRNRVAPGSEIVFDVRRPERVAMSLRKQLQVYYERDAGLIQSELLWPDPAQGARIHNALIDRFISTSLELKNRKLRETVQILRDQYAYSTQRLKDAELALQQFRIEAITEPTEPRPSVGTDGVVTRDPVFDMYFNRKIQREMLQKDVKEIEDILARAQSGEPLNILRLRMVPSVANSAPLQATISELDTKIVERRTKLYTWTEAHPEVRRVTAQIEQLRSRTIPLLAGRLVADLQGQASAIQADIASATRELREIPTRSIEEGRRRRQFELAEKLHNNLLDRLNNAMLAERTSLPDLQVLDYAFAPRRPTSGAGSIFFVLIGGLAGMSVGLVGVLVHDKLDTRIHHPSDISEKFGLPLLGVVPRLNLNGRNPVATASALESFRSIRTQIAHAGNGAGRHILVTSSVPREGKSTVAANLAISSAAAGYRTLLLDVDVRRGRTYELFGLSRAPGLTDYLLERANLEEVTQFYEPANLDVITAGSLSGYNPELLDSDRMSELLHLLGERYDVVMMDGPPLASGADVLLLGERCDKVVMVFRAGTTSYEMARTRLDLLGNVQLPIVGAVLNAVPDTAPYYDQYVASYYAEAEVSS
ncbi:MAG: polysaccharide biosynthesis tyrosine autokinase [Gemmatimonadota bacterium]